MKSLIVTEADFANLSLIEAHAPLRRLLDHAIVVPSDAIPADVVTMNTQVALTEDGTGTRRLFSLVYPQDADAAKGRISVLEALGMALLGASPGHNIECDFPEGTRCLRVEKVIYQPEYSLRTLLVFRVAEAVKP